LILGAGGSMLPGKFGQEAFQFCYGHFNIRTAGCVLMIRWRSHLAAQFIMHPQNQERFDRLRALAPIDAVRTWLDGDFGIGDEPAMIAAIRKDPRVSLSDDNIIDAVCDAMEESLDAPACLERLARSR
jgi:hypothetical protein